MKKYLLIPLLFLAIQVSAQQQQTEGIVYFNYTQYWTKIIKRLTFLSKEEKERSAMTWKNEEGYTQKMKLFFSPSQSLYSYNNDEIEGAGYSWRKEEYSIYRNFDQDKKFDVIEMLGKVYIVDDSLNTPKWKISNQIKDIAGFICMKATMDDPVRGQKVTAWFAQDIPVGAGPERYFGLPGMILGIDLNEGDVIIEASKVEFKPVTAELKQPKAKGKKIKDSDYDTIISNHIKDSMKASRNPFWAIRY
nr:GLPGLI family protein [uncultured Arsenicibacter sp.]